MTMNPKSGWYPCPSGADQVRFWNGSAWTSRTNPRKPEASEPEVGEPGANELGNHQDNGWITVGSNTDDVDVFDQGSISGGPAPSQAPTDAIQVDAPRWATRLAESKRTAGPASDEESAQTVRADLPVDGGVRAESVCVPEVARSTDEVGPALRERLNQTGRKVRDRVQQTQSVITVWWQKATAVAHQHAVVISWTVFALALAGVFGAASQANQSQAAADTRSAETFATAAGSTLSSSELRCIAENTSTTSDAPYLRMAPSEREELWAALSDCGSWESKRQVVAESSLLVIPTANARCAAGKFLENVEVSDLAASPLPLAWGRGVDPDTAIESFKACSVPLKRVVRNTIEVHTSEEVADCVVAENRAGGFTEPVQRLLAATSGSEVEAMFPGCTPQ